MYLLKVVAPHNFSVMQKIIPSVGSKAQSLGQGKECVVLLSTGAIIDKALVKKYKGRRAAVTFVR